MGREVSTETWFDSGYACPFCHHAGLDVISPDNDGDYACCPECEREFVIILALVLDTVPHLEQTSVEVDLEVWGDALAGSAL